MTSKSNHADLLEIKRQQIVEKERQLELREGLPFIHGWLWYPWAREFFESTNKLNFLCAANQISKSSTQIRKVIDWATNKQKWPLLWRRPPVQFWYLYPTANQAKIEFETKWQQFLPKGKFKDDPQYGWKAEIRNKELFAIHFNSGVHLYFKSYAQDVQSLQTGTCDAIFCDEELPVELYPELIFRISASDGYFHMVFTATLGQAFWKSVIETRGEGEKLVEAAKWQVSMFDCMKYEDGTESHWTPEKIQQAINRCGTHKEVLRRIYGKFVVDEGLKYESFDLKKHVKPYHPINPGSGWHIFGGADIGSGGHRSEGKAGHKSAIVFIAVSPDYRQGRVFMGWRGDGIATTAGDVLNKFIEMRGKYKMTAQYYDWACRDFYEMAGRAGEAFEPAEKNHAIGEGVLNVLFKNDMLAIYDTPELQKLAWELSNLKTDTAKNKAEDDFCDALRYAAAKIPWDWSAITGAAPEVVEEGLEPQGPRSKEELMKEELAERMAAFRPQPASGESIFQEIEEWNELY